LIDLQNSFAAAEADKFPTSVLLHYLGKLKNHLHGLMPEDIIDTAIYQWRKRVQTCVRANGGYFEHLLRTNSRKLFAFSSVFGSSGICPSCHIFTVLILDGR